MNIKNHMHSHSFEEKIGLKNRSTDEKKKGFTLIEILVVIGIIAILAAVVLVAINPSRQFKLARDSQRISNVNSILNAIDQNMAEHGGVFTCGTTTPAIPSAVSGTLIADSAHGGPIESFDVASCLVPAYISALPFDPSKDDAFYTSTSSYDTDYDILQDTDGRITVRAEGEINQDISATR